MLHVDRATDLLVAVCYDRREAIQGCGPVLGNLGVEPVRIPDRIGLREPPEGADQGVDSREKIDQAVPAAFATRVTGRKAAWPF